MAIFVKNLIFSTIFFNFLQLFSCQSTNLHAEPIAPLPEENAGAIKDLINSFFNANSDSSTKNADQSETAGDSMPKWPLTLINSSSYWDLENLEPEQSISDIKVAKKWVGGYLEQAEIIFNAAAVAGWNYFTNFTEENRKILVDSERVLAMFLKTTATQARQFDLVSLKGNSSMQRMLQMLSLEGLSALPEENFTEFTGFQRKLGENFANGAVCEQGHPPPCTLRFGELQQIMASTFDPSKLAYAWLAWYNSVGPKNRQSYLEMAKLSNFGAQMNGFVDAGELWRSPYEGTAPTLGEGPMFSLQTELEALYNTILPLYAQLHSYIRWKLASIFPPNSVPELTTDGPLPPHILGTMEGDNWMTLYHSTAPYSAYFTASAESLDHLGGPYFPPEDALTAQLRKNNYTVHKLFKQAESFYRSLGFNSLPESFWNDSIFTRPWDRDVFCYPPAAFDLRNTEDYRVKICAEISRDHFIEAHRLLGHTYYQRQYRNLSLPFREGSNPSIAKALAEALAMASANPAYLQSLNLSIVSLQDSANEKGDEEMDVEDKAEINRLYSEALQFVAPLPSHLVVDFWRWGVFDGQINETSLNAAWWKLKERLQGIKPLGERSEAHFDPGATTTISQQQFPAVRNFLAYVMQFQILESLCKYAGYKGELNIQKCNIYGSKKAGSKLQRLMSKGISETWQKSLKRLTGQDYVDAGPLMEYFKPLKKWLEMKNSRAGAYVGWDGSGVPFNFTFSEIGDHKPPWGISEPAGAAVDINAVEPMLPGRDDVAFPGEDCSGGKFCLQDSTCNGTHCICAAGMVQWQEYCLPNDPNVAGFGGEEDGGIFVNVVQEVTEAADDAPTEESTDTDTGISSGVALAANVGLVCLLLLAIMIY